MAGLLAANILRRHNPTVIERQSGLPENHSALLRFRSRAVSSATGIPFKQVWVRKGIWDGQKVVNECTIPLGNAYSARIGDGAIHDRSIWKMEQDIRYIAPPNFVHQMGASVHNLQLDTPFSRIDHMASNSPVISTLPMPVMMRMFDYPEWGGEFKSFPIWTFRVELHGDVQLYQTIYNGSISPHNRIPGKWYRATIHGRELTIESSSEFGMSSVMAMTILNQCFGFPEDVAAFAQEPEPVVRKQEYGKILPIPEAERTRFMVWLTDNHNIYSLGRFATWRPILLDDLVKDIEKIEQMIQSPSSYQRRLSTTRN